jgi:hypothetical protein
VPPPGPRPATARPPSPRTTPWAGLGAATARRSTWPATDGGCRWP